MLQPSIRTFVLADLKCYMCGATAGSIEGLPASHSWLVDLLAYGVYQALGGTGLVLAKALLVAALAFLLVQLSRVGRSWWLAVFCTALALLAMQFRSTPRKMNGCWSISKK